MSKSSLIEQLAFTGGSSESFESGNIEYEVETYISGFDIDEIASKSISNEHQEQWGIYVPKTDKNAAGGSVRVRMTEIGGDDPVYVLTSKVEAGEKGKFEEEDPSSERQFKQFSMLADQGLIKQRFVIPHETTTGVKFNLEVDVFRNKSGELVPWAKIDAEMTVGSKITPEDIPLKRDEIIMVTPSEKINDTTGVTKKIQELYKKYFVAGNKHI